MLKLVKTQAYTSEDEAKILSELQAKFQGQIDPHIEYVDDIPRTARGNIYIWIKD